MGISTGILAAIIVGSVFCVLLIVAVTVLLVTRHSRYHQVLSRKNLCKYGRMDDQIKL